MVRSYGVAAGIGGVSALDGLMSDMMNNGLYRARWKEVVVVRKIKYVYSYGGVVF